MSRLAGGDVLEDAGDGIDGDVHVVDEDDGVLGGSCGDLVATCGGGPGGDCGRGSSEAEIDDDRRLCPHSGQNLGLGGPARLLPHSLQNFIAQVVVDGLNAAMRSRR